MCISIFLLGSFFFFVFVVCTNYQVLGHKGLLQLNLLHYAHFVPCTSSFSSVRVWVESCAVSHERRTLKRFVCFASRFCTFGFCILLCLQHLFSFFSRRTYSSGSNIFFLNLIKIECIVSELFKSSVKFVSANSFVCRSYLSPTGSHCT